MTPSTNTVRQLLAALGASLAVLVAAGPVRAVPDGYQPQASSTGPDLVDRYLARHPAQEERAYQAEPTVIPYLSHGIGIEDGNSPAAPVADPGFDRATTGFVAGGILAAMLLAVASTVALRGRRGLRSV